MTSGGKRITVLVVDHNPILLRGIMSLIQSEAALELVGTATNNAEAITLFLSQSPRVVLMDLDLPDSSALWAIRDMNNLQENVRIIGLATYELDRIGGIALENGAQAVISKERISEDLIPAIHQVLEFPVARETPDKSDEQG
jgi:DNA-binding NarL/FixJ family response regulator